MFNNLPSDPTATDLAWLMFTQSGQIGFYMLYKELGDTQKKDRLLE